MRKMLGSMLVAVLAATAAWAGERPAPVVAMQEMFGGGSYLGVDTTDVTKDRVAALKLKNESGVEVTMVDQDAPAGKAGVKEHDVILTFNGETVESVEQLRRLIRETPPGRTVALGISRDGQPMTVKVALADRQKMFNAGRHGRTVTIPDIKVEIPPMPPMPAMPDMEMPNFNVVMTTRSRGGLMVENLTPQLGDFFGVRNGEGVLVRSVEKGSAAERAGFKAGDVVVSIGGEKVADAGDWSRMVRRRNGATTIGIVRDKRPQNLTITLPETRRRNGDSSELYLGMDDLKDELASLRANKEWQTQMNDRNSEFQKSIRQFQEEMQKNKKELERQLRELQKDLKRESED